MKKVERGKRRENSSGKRKGADVRDGDGEGERRRKVKSSHPVDTVAMVREGNLLYIYLHLLL